jgi:plasmid stabilization system protein ParE
MKVVWSRLAIRHLVHLREYIERDSEQNAALVAGASRILKVVDLLQTYPYVIPSGPAASGWNLIAVFHGRQKLPGRL